MVTLEYDDLTLELPNPVIGNRLEANVQRIYRNSRGNDPQVFRDPNWPTTQVISVQFENLTRTQRDDFFDFLSQSLGQEIYYTDYNNTRWKGVIITPNGNSLEKDQECGFVVEFQFDGERV